MPGVMKNAPPLPIKPLRTPPMKPSITTWAAPDQVRWVKKPRIMSGCI